VGMPSSLIERANQILKQLEESRGGETDSLKEGIKKNSGPESTAIHI